MIKFAVISFPGTNCEAETVRAFKRYGMDAEMVLWNDPGLLDESRCSEFSGYAIAGGFSFEDRGRSGVVAAQEKITEIIKKEADAGKVVLGICNGAQILVETGLIPGFDNKALAMALAWNEMKKGGEIVGTGFYNDWAYLKNSAPKGRSAFNDFDELLHIPFAHGEGRFVITEELLQKLEANNQIPFKYSDKEGNVNTEFPYTPNGAKAAAAAVCNPAGNVMAIMPHPERDPNGNGKHIFESIKRWIEEGKKVDYSSLGDYESVEDVRQAEAYDIEVLVRLIITDNTERTIEEALLRKDYKLHLDRFEYYGVKLVEGADKAEVVKKMVESGEVANLNKHMVFVKMDGKTYGYDAGKGLTERELNLENILIAIDKPDSIGESKCSAINAHAGNIAKMVRFGVMWNVAETDDDTVQKVIDSKVLYNPYSMYLTRG